MWNDRGSLLLPVRISERVRAGVVAIPWGWWAAQHATQHAEAHSGGQVANSLTSDTLTDWGGGVSYYDTMVAVGPA